MVSHFVFVLVGVILASADVGRALHLEIKPATYTEDTQGGVDLVCSLDNVDTAVMVIFQLEIEKEGGQPIAVIRKENDIVYGTAYSDRSKFQAEGLIATDVSKSYLKLSLLEPGKYENGTFLCRMYYTDISTQMKEHRASANLIVDKLDVHGLVKQLLAKVATLEKKLEQSTNDSIMMKDMSKRMDHLEDKDSTLTDKMVVLEKSNHNQSERIDYLEDQVTYETIAFTATQSQIDLSKGATVVFPDVLMNQGQCYDEKTGIFTAPRAGFYTFLLSVLSQCNGCIVQVSLKINDNTLSNLFAYDVTSIEHSSKTFIAELEKGDTVKVAVYGNAKLYSGGWNVFSGYLVRPR